MGKPVKYQNLAAIFLIETFRPQEQGSCYFNAMRESIGEQKERQQKAALQVMVRCKG
jgi:hypothetical protein